MGCSATRVNEIVDTKTAAVLASLLTSGHIFYVDSGNSSAGTSAAHGTTVEAPFSTIAAAIGYCTANVGDIIVVAGRHTETISAAAGINLNKAGVTIIGRGRGSNRPTITFTATTSTFKFSADNCSISNLRFVSAVDSLAMFLDLSAEYCTVEDCRFTAPTGSEALSFIQPLTTKDNFEIRRCKFFQPSDPEGTDGGAGTGCFYIVDSENILIEECEFYGNFETAIFHNRTTACKNLWVRDCRGIQSLSGAEPYQLVDGANGAQLGGGFITPAEAAATEATLVGTIGNSFFILQPAAFGNDGAAGGQGGIIVATAS